MGGERSRVRRQMPGWGRKPRRGGGGGYRVTEVGRFSSDRGINASRTPRGSKRKSRNPAVNATKLSLSSRSVTLTGSLRNSSCSLLSEHTRLGIPSKSIIGIHLFAFRPDRETALGVRHGRMRPRPIRASPARRRSREMHHYCKASARASARLPLLFSGLALLFGWRVQGGGAEDPGGRGAIRQLLGRRLPPEETEAGRGLPGNLAKNTAEMAQVLEAHLKINLRHRASWIAQQHARAVDPAPDQELPESHPHDCLEVPAEVKFAHPGFASNALQ